MKYEPEQDNKVAVVAVSCNNKSLLTQPVEVVVAVEEEERTPEPDKFVAVAYIQLGLPVEPVPHVDVLPK